MKKLLNRLPKRILAGVTVLALVAGIASSALAGFGPDRPTVQWHEGIDGFDYVTFNSFTGVGGGIGDERDFFRGVQVGRDSIWSDPVASVNQGAEVEAKIYIHNNADARLNDAPGNPGIAKNVKVRVAVPTGAKQSQDATAYISSETAQPLEVFDTLTMSGANNGFFELDYVEGSAKVHRNGQATAISDTLVTTGVNLGDQPGCFDDIQEVTFRMKVKMPNYTIKKQVALPGQTSADWKESVTVNQGDTVSWLITFENTGATQLDAVKIVDEVPAGLTVVPGTVKLTNGNYLNGYVYPDSAIQANGRQVNVDIGSYNPASMPGHVAYVSFRTTVDQRQGAEACSDKTLLNKAFATPSGFGSIYDTAEVITAAEICQDVATFRCELLTIAKTTGREIKITDLKTPVTNGATFKHAVINWGDKTTPLTTNNTVGQTHTYAADGTYNVVAKAVFTVNGAEKTVTSEGCKASVTFGTPTTLPKTGAGDMLGIFAAVTAAGAIAHRYVLSRRLI